MGKRRFEYSDEKSNKFWEITLDGSEHTVCYGRIGSDGQSKTKSFDSDEAATKDAEKLIKSKMKKGYAEVESEGADTTDIQGLLGGLCQTDADREILNKLHESVVKFTEDTIVFEDDMECEYAAGIKVVAHSDMPKSFTEIMGVVSTLCWDGGGPEVGYYIEEDGASGADGWLFDEVKDDEPDEFAKIEAAGDVIASFVGGQNALFFDPTAKLSNGEPAMAFLSHEGGGWEQVKSVSELDYGQILLRMLADAMIETDYIPEIYF